MKLISILTFSTLISHTRLQYTLRIAYAQCIPNAADDFMTELNKMYDEFSADIITGAKPIEAFDEFVTKWYANGGQILTDEANELYNPNN